MLMAILERYDEMENFTFENRLQIAMRNIRRRHVIGKIFVFFYIFLLSTSYVVTGEFTWHPVYLAFPALLFLYYILTKRLDVKFSQSILYARIICLSFYALTFVCGILYDGYIRPDRTPLCYLLLFMAFSACYADDIRYVALFQILCTAMYPALMSAVFPEQFVMADVMAAIFVLVLSFCTYILNLGVQTDGGLDSRVLRDKSMTDLLTGLLNKIAFETKTKTFLAKREEGDVCGLVILDFDNFKHVNDNYGHQIGDEVLKSFARILNEYFRSKDIIGRVGGDEFMVFLTNDIPRESIDARCENIQHTLRTLKIGDAGPFSCSIGIAVDRAGSDFQTLYNTADTALYHAKENGKACHHILEIEKTGTTGESR